MTFYQDILDGEFQVVMRYKDGPPKYSKPEIEQKIMHLTMTFGNGGELSASDSFHMPLNKGNNFHVRLLADDEKQGQAIFDGLSEKAQITMPYNEVFWGGKFGSLIDKYGVQWMISGSDET
jgi:PhnB protein